MIDPTPKQTAFLIVPNKEVLYGGSAGGGKSVGVLAAASQYLDIPGYSALILRQTYKDLALPGALMDMSHQWWKGTAAKWVAKTYTWEFPSGATLSFGYLETEKDKYNYQGSAFQFCVERTTPILMGDNTWKPINTIQVGELVQTLQGPKRVNSVMNLGSKPLVKVTTPCGSVLVSTTHRLLTSSGWASPQALQPKRFHDGHIHSESSKELSLVPYWLDESQQSSPSPILGSSQQVQGRIALLEKPVLSTDGRSGYEGSCDEPQGSQPPQEWYARLVLHAPAVHSITASSYTDAPHVRSCGSSGHKQPSSPHDCLPCSHSHDGQSHLGSIDDPTLPPLQDDAETLFPLGSCLDDPPHIPSHIQSDRYEYLHPYTNRPTEARVGVLETSARMALAGEGEVWDLTVEEASHYVASGGIIASNCGYDELTQFETESRYLYLFSRLRRNTDFPVPLRMRSTTNPGGIGMAWVKQRFITNPEDRIFIPASLEDNPYLDREEYEDALDLLDPVTRQQLRFGDWDIDARGGMFKRDWFDIIQLLPNIGYTVRYWDMASSTEAEFNDPDWTVGTKMSLTPDGKYVIWDLKRFRGTPKENEELVAQTAAEDGSQVEIFMEQEPGSAGKTVIDHYRRNILPGYTFRADKDYRTTKKEIRAKPFSAAAEDGQIALLLGNWLSPWLDEHIIFPDGRHDDQVDSAVGAFQMITKMQRKATGTHRVGQRYRR